MFFSSTTEWAHGCTMDTFLILFLFCSMWYRAVWKEGQKEVEAVIPDNWIVSDLVFWPNVVNAEKALKNRQKPTSSWRAFPLIKVKCKSGKYSFTIYIYHIIISDHGVIKK